MDLVFSQEKIEIKMLKEKSLRKEGGTFPAGLTPNSTLKVQDSQWKRAVFL